jgi:hypothetical protein
MPSNKSKSESKPITTTTSNVETTDNKIVADNGSIAASGGSTINFLSKDVAMEALETAVELGKASIGQSGAFLDGVIQVADANAQLTENSRIGNANLALDLAQTAIDKVVKNNESADVQVLSVVGKYGAWIAGALAAAFALFFIFRSKSKN